MTGPLMQQLRALADARAAKIAHDDESRALRLAFEEQHFGLFVAQKDAASTVAALETSVRTLAAEAYLNTQEKKPAPGVEIKRFKTMKIVDPGAALAWSQRTGMALLPEAIDEAALLKIAAATPLPFVHYGEETRVTIATQLNAAVYAEVPVEASA